MPEKVDDILQDCLELMRRGTPVRIQVATVSRGSDRVAGGRDPDFQATASLPSGTYYNQVEAKYDPWWSVFDTKTRSSQTAPVTVGGGTKVSDLEGRRGAVRGEMGS